MLERKKIITVTTLDGPRKFEGELLLEVAGPFVLIVDEADEENPVIVAVFPDRVVMDAGVR